MRGEAIWLACALIIATALGCHQAPRGSATLNPQQIEAAIAELRAAYGAFNRGDIDATVRSLDANVEWIEPAEFPEGGEYHGVQGAKRYLAQSRASAAQLISEPEQFIAAGDRILVFVHARRLPKDSDTWRERDLADVYTFRDGRVMSMRAFGNREDALRWVGIEERPK